MSPPLDFQVRLSDTVCAAKSEHLLDSSNELKFSVSLPSSVCFFSFCNPNLVDQCFSISPTKILARGFWELKFADLKVGEDEKYCGTVDPAYEIVQQQKQ